MKKKSAESQTLFSIIPRCLFCGGNNRLTFACGGDDWGNYVTVKCCRAGCEAEGPHVRVMIWEGDTVTDAMRQEAADGWSSVWDYVDIRRPAAVLVDRDCKEVAPAPRRQRRRARQLPARAATAPAPETREYSPALSTEHQALVIPAPKTNGVHGMNGHGAAR